MNLPTPEQAAATVAFADREGPQWKEALRSRWALASYPRDPNTGHLLQQLRNQLGPQWLGGASLKQLKAIAGG